MRKIIKMFLVLTGIMTIVSCSNKKTYSLKEASGFETSNIVDITASESVYQNFAWVISEKANSYLDCKYIQVDFDINNEFLSTWPPSELEDDAYCLHINVKDIDLYEKECANFYVSHNTKYMYFYGIGGTYRSLEKMSSNFIDLIKNKY